MAPAGEVSSVTQLPESALQVVPASPHVASLRGNSIARLVADLLGIVFALVAATVTARLLGPAGKGYYSSLVLLTGLFVQLFSAGLGEAAIVLSGRGRASLQGAASATAFAVVPLSVAGALLFFLIARFFVPTPTGDPSIAPVFAALMVGVIVLYTTSVSFLVAKERLVPVAAASVLSNGATTVLVWLFLAVFHLGAAGALLAAVLGSGSALLVTLVLIRRSGLSLRPQWDASYLKRATRFGAALQFSNLLVLLTARIDLVLVYRLSTAAEAGSYSIALTVGSLVGAVPIAISYASFPRLSLLGEREAGALTAQVFRVGIASALVAAAGLAVVTPFAVPIVFGQPYAGAVGPTLLLIPGGVLWSAQWLLCRAAAARGAPAALLVSFAVGFSIMVSLDLVLIPPLGAMGAALASLVAPCVGVTIAWLFHRKLTPGWRVFVPRASDFVSFVATIRGMVGRVGGRSSGVETTSPQKGD